MPSTDKTQIAPTDQRCLDACNACADACDFCATACLREPDPAALARCIALDIDCAAACRLAAGAVARGSEMAGTICTMCATLCHACAGECERHAKMHHCAACATACRRCAAECERMAVTAEPVSQTGR